MNLWALDDEPVAASRPRVKKTCFADEVEVASTSGWGADTQSQRRKQRGKVEFLVEDHQTSDDDADDDDPRNVKVVNAKANQISSADIVEAVLSEDSNTELAKKSKSKQERQDRKQQKRENPKSDQEITVHHLVREFLLMHCHEDVAKLLDKERPMPRLGVTEVKQLSRRLTGTDESPPVPTSLLERFLVCSNNAKLKARKKRSAKERTASAKETQDKAPPTGRRKPELNVITSNLDQAITLINVQANGDYNLLDHPGSTPHHHQIHGTVIGEPGHTPMARARDLRSMGFDDVDDDVDDDDEKALDAVSTEEPNGDAEASEDQLSHYAIRKRTSKTGQKRVQLGNPGSTPTKEYIFFRETPPSFVTETIEDAVDVFEKLGNDPEFVKQAVVVERFIELQSSEVSKYNVGQAIDGLGAKADISGVVSKVYGSRLCGTAGPGTIVIDTCPTS